MKIAIIAGGGNFPIQIARQNKDAFVLCIEGYSYQNLFENQSATVSLLEPLHWLTILKNNNITDIVMAGKINRPSNLNNISNEKANELINQIISVGDNAALNYIEEFFNNNGFKILPINSILKDCFFSKGFYVEDSFSQKFKDFVLKNAKFGAKLLNTISKFDVGQSVVVNNELVYAIEGLEGTNSMIDRVGALYNQNKNHEDFGPVLIKIPKIGQNLNLDLPVIGLETIKKCQLSGLSSIVVSSTGTLIVELNKVFAYIKKNKFCIYAI